MIYDTICIYGHLKHDFQATSRPLIHISQLASMSRSLSAAATFKMHRYSSDIPDRDEHADMRSNVKCFALFRREFDKSLVFVARVKSRDTS